MMLRQAIGGCVFAISFAVVLWPALGLAQNNAAPTRGAQMEKFPAVKLRALDKITARSATFEVEVGEVLHFGSLYIKPQACEKNPPIETPESASFLQIWEKTVLKDEKGKVIPQLMDQTHWVFSGWMFASSPGLSYMDHPIYDVWVLDCLSQPQPDNAAEEPAQGDEVLEGEGQIRGGDAPDLPEVEVDPVVDPRAETDAVITP